MQAIEEIIEKCSKKWGKVDTIDDLSISVTNWLSQFDDSNDFNERVVATKLLDNVNYYNSLKISQTCFWLFEQYQTVVGEELGLSLFFPIVSQNGRLNHSYDILRRIEEVTELDRSFFVGDLELTSKNVSGFKNVVFVDDVSGSGKTIIDNFNYMKERYPQLINGKKVYCLLIEVTEEAYDRIISFFDEEGIDGEVLFFNKHKRAFSANFIFSQQEYVKARTLIEDLENKIVGTNKNFLLGYDKSECLISFSYGPPNNTLAIFWYERDFWEPIFKRKNGKIKPQFQTKQGKKQERFKNTKRNNRASYMMKRGKKN
jgi:hypothetical protein